MWLNALKNRDKTIKVDRNNYEEIDEEKWKNFDAS